MVNTQFFIYVDTSEFFVCRNHTKKSRITDPD